MNNPETIKEITANHFKIPVELLSDKTRQRDIVRARHCAMVLIKEFTELSLTSIGLFFGSRDHSSVIHAIGAIQDAEDTDKAFKLDFALLKEKVMCSVEVNSLLPIEMKNEIDEEFKHLI